MRQSCLSLLKEGGDSPVEVDDLCRQYCFRIRPLVIQSKFKNLRPFSIVRPQCAINLAPYPKLPIVAVLRLGEEFLVFVENVIQEPVSEERHRAAKLIRLSLLVGGLEVYN